MDKHSYHSSQMPVIKKMIVQPPYTPQKKEMNARNPYRFIIKGDEKYRDRLTEEMKKYFKRLLSKYRLPEN